jgi:type II secretory pathway predicted ATPase ExeA
MYEKFFNFKVKPFAMSPDPAFLYPSNQHENALTMLEYAIVSQAPFCLLTGEIGSGKTTLLRHFLRRIGDSISVGLISNTHRRFRSILPWALSAFSIVPADDTEIAQYEALVDYFVREYAKGHRTLLVVDEAHNLTPTILEELRLLSNVNSERDLALQVLLVGQPELRRTLDLPELVQFAQRVSVDFHLGPLNLAEARAYIHHRLKVAGGDSAIFTDETIAFVHGRTGGVPRLINQLCDMALVYAFADQKRQITVQLLQQILLDRKRRGAIPLFTSRPAAPQGSPATSLTPERG